MIKPLNEPHYEKTCLIDKQTSKAQISRASAQAGLLH